MEEEDLNANINRDEFEGLITEPLQRVRAVLTELKKSLDEKKISINSVEIVGGTCRIPIIQSII